MNKVILVGRLTKDPELRQLPSGVAYANFTLAVNRPFTSREGEKTADFIPIVVWNKQAENCAKYLFKGSQAGVSGRIQIRNYTANDGSKRYVTEVVAEEVEFLSSRNETQQQRNNSQNRSSYSSNNDYSSGDSDPFFGIPIDGFEEIDDLDVPF